MAKRRTSATGGRRPPEPLLPGRNHRVQALRNFAEEIKIRQRDQADPNNTLLSPDEIAGEYLVSRGLMTTLGGVLRPITTDDLKQFSYNIRQLKRAGTVAKLRGGIRAKAVIDRSREEDRQRANAEIRMANPTHYRAMTEGGGQATSLVVGFYCNASPDSPFTHHNVNVQFLDFGAVVASPTKADKIVKELTGGRLRFECSCPRFKYFFRYLNTQLETVYGRGELSFPKIRNPGLTGMACKHLLRVMQVIDRSPTFKSYMAKVIQRFRDDIEHIQGVERIKDQREIAEAMLKESWDQRKIRTTEQKRMARMATTQRRAQRAGTDLAKKAVERAKAKEAAKAAKDRAAALKGLEANARKLLMLGAITQQQFDQMMAAARASQ